MWQAEPSVHCPPDGWEEKQTVAAADQPPIPPPIHKDQQAACRAFLARLPDLSHPIPVSTGRPEQKATAHQRKEVSPKQHPGRMSNSREHQLGIHQQDAWPSSVTFSSLEEKMVSEAGWLGMGSG